MKKKHVILEILFFIFFSIILLKSNNIMAAEKTDYIIVGDSRTLGLYGSVTGNWTSQPINTTKKVNEKNVKFLAVSGIGYDYWFGNSSNYSKITSALSEAKNGSSCLIWLGINGNITDDYAVKYVNALEILAKKHPNVKIYFCSVTGIYNKEYDKYYSPMNNTKITNFNNKVNSLIKQKSKSNLLYMDVANTSVKIGSESRTVNNWVINSSKHASDGLHYSSELYKAIWEQAMTGKATKTSSSSNVKTTIKSSIQMSDKQDKREEVEFSDVLTDLDGYSDVGDIETNSKSKVENTTGKILSFITNIGIVLSILIPAIIGIKYMILGNMEFRKDLVPYIIGATILFSICLITKIIYNIGKGINSI